MQFDYIKRGDCMELIKNVPDESVDLVVTDCPYRVIGGGCTNDTVTFKTMRGVMDKRVCSMEKQAAEYVKAGKIFRYNDIDFGQWVPEVYRVLKPGTHCYITINGRNLSQLQQFCESSGFKYQNLLVWDKGNATPNKWYMNTCEFILMLRKGKAKNINNMGSKTVLHIPNVRYKQHPTQKPVELMRLLIENSSNEGDIVLDPFMGSGSTCVACKNSNRHYIGFELDQEYFVIASRRLDEAKELAERREKERKE